MINPLNSDLTFKYLFRLETGEELEYSVEISNETIISKFDAPEKLPDWTRLENNKCSNCQLKDSDYCPVALRLIEPVRIFNNLRSHSPAQVTVIAPERNYIKDTDLQDGLRSMFGLIMATSGCPSMNIFRPMAFYHLPFSTVNETIYRMLSMYLVGRFLQNRDKGVIPASITDIEDIYDTVQQVNLGIRERLLQCSKDDGSLNALTILDSIACIVPLQMEQALQEFDRLFKEVG